VNASVAVAFDEARLPHRPLLGKETVQNLLVLRFANSIFEPLWNQKYIDHVQITVAESEGVSQFDEQTGEMTASRVGYYEGVGALRDMVQNHMLQVLCLTAMEPPYSLDATCARPKVACPLPPADERCRRGRSVVRHSTSTRRVRPPRAGLPLRGAQVFRADRQEAGPAESLTPDETFVAIRLFIDNWRWAGVPFYLRTGKRLPKRASEVAIQFKDVPNVLSTPIPRCRWSHRAGPSGAAEEGLSMRSPRSCRGPRCGSTR